MKRRNVDEYYLNEFRELLKTATREELINYFDTYILNSEIEDINGLKRSIFLLMKDTDNPEINKKYYNLYQKLKNKTIGYDEAKEAYFSIRNVN